MKNKVILIGRVGQDPEVKHFENSNTVANFSLATTEKYKNKAGETCENTEWHNIQVWGKLAEVAEKYVKKGSLLCIEGKIHYESWDDKEGNKKHKTVIVSDLMQMIPTGQAKEKTEPDTLIKDHGPEEFKDDLPF